MKDNKKKRTAGMMTSTDGTFIYIQLHVNINISQILNKCVEVVYKIYKLKCHLISRE
jgi:hypothetical protein